jgi:hypothetical protein
VSAISSVGLWLNPVGAGTAIINVITIITNHRNDDHYDNRQDDRDNNHRGYYDKDDFYNRQIMIQITVISLYSTGPIHRICSHHKGQPHTTFG